MSAFDTASARRYLLGQTSERDSDAIEHEFFRTDEALDAMMMAEDALIGDYLANRLSSDDRARFESHYLATHEHRTRVDTIRRLSLMSGPAAAPGSSGIKLRLLALAACLVAITGAGLWIAFSRSGGVEPMAPPVASPHATVFAFAVSPVTVRGAAETPALIVPAGIDLVGLQFETSGNARPVDRGRVVIRTVAGADVWQGPIATKVGLPPGIIATVEIPANRLRTDDYTVTLLEITAAGAESERDRYFLRVRAR